MKSLREIEIALFSEELSVFKSRLFQYREFRIMWDEIEKHHSEATFNLERVAGKCGDRDGNRLNEHLKTAGFETFHPILTKYRIHRAAVMLLTTRDSSIVDVAIAVGIDQSTLDRNFKKFLSITPRELRDGQPCSRGAASGSPCFLLNFPLFVLTNPG